MSSDFANLPLRDDLRGETPYGAPQLDIPVCLNVNENPYAPPKSVADAIVKRAGAAALKLNRYPDREHVALRDALAGYINAETDAGIKREQVWAGNGSNEIMLQLFQAFGGPGKTALGFSPTYSMYPEYARDTFTKWKTVSRREDFTIDPKSAAEEIRRIGPSVVMIANPNNPTGTYIENDDLRILLDVCKEVRVKNAPESARPVVVVDEAYAEFRTPGLESAISLIGEYPNLAVSRTMSKAFAFAGTRLGYLIGNENVVNALRIVRLPYHLSALTQAASLAALEHSGELLAQVSHLRETRDETEKWFKTLQYCGRPIKNAESESNFIMFGVFTDRDFIFDELKKRGVLIRAVGPEGYLRVCMGTDEEMRIFREKFAEVLQLANERDGK